MSDSTSCLGCSPETGYFLEMKDHAPIRFRPSGSQFGYNF
jgi:hypothetical protein